MARMENITDYASADAFWKSKQLTGRKKKTHVYIGHNTTIRPLLGKIGYVVEYHGNQIIRYYSNGTVLVKWAGWATSTTTQRLHALTPKGYRFNRRLGETLINGRAVDPYDWQDLEDFTPAS